MISKLTFTLLLIDILSLPLYVVRFKFWHYPTTLLEIFIITTAVFWFFDNWVSKNLIGLFKTIIEDELFKLISLFLLSGIIALLVTPDLRGGLGIFKAYFIEPVLIYFILKQVVSRTNRYLIIRAFHISLIWLSVIAISQIFHNSFVFFAPSQIVQGRATAVYNSANALGLYLNPIILVSIFFSYWPKKEIFGVVTLPIILLGLFTIFLTRSEGSYVALVVSFLSGLLIRFLISKFGSKLARKVALAILVLIFLIGVFMPISSVIFPKLTPPVSGQNYIGTNTYLIRNYLWKGTLGLIADYPLFGAGLNGFKPVYFENYRMPQYDEALQYPHNLYLNFWVETGFLGLVVWLAILVRIAIKALSTKKFSLELLVFLVYILTHGIVDVPYFKNDLSAQFWILVALLI